MQKILIIQTAFIGDVILATPVIEKLHAHFPQASIHFLLRKGNEGLLDNHPKLDRLIIWDKKKQKLKNLFRLIIEIRKNRYDLVVNLHRFVSTGIIAGFSKGKHITGFDKNALSFLFHKKTGHIFGTDKNPVHEIDRNLATIEHLTDKERTMPKLYPPGGLIDSIKPSGEYICFAPTSVWFTKQLPAQKWIEMADRIRPNTTIILLGAKTDREACENIKQKSKHQNIVNKAGEVNFLESAALMQHANMNYVNDSAPMHLASSVNAPVTAIFCSTVPRFGFGPLSEKSRIVETDKHLDCRPCGLHGFKECPKGHFKCGDIDVGRILAL